MKRANAIRISRIFAALILAATAIGNYSLVYRDLSLSGVTRHFMVLLIFLSSTGFLAYAFVSLFLKDLAGFALTSVAYVSLLILLSTAQKGIFAEFAAHFATLSRFDAWTMPTVFACGAFFLFYIRHHMPILYGTVEFVVGIIAAMWTIPDMYGGQAISLLQFSAGIYIMVRGVDNVGRGIGQLDSDSPIRGIWEDIYPPR